MAFNLNAVDESNGYKARLKNWCPPVLWQALRNLKEQAARNRRSQQAQDAAAQSLDIYWDENMARILETWGDGSVWHEIQMLLHDQTGLVLDIACGTGKTMQLLERFSRLEVHGCDISDLLISKASNRGIAPARLKVTDATRMDYLDSSFDFAYSIGSFEHFTESGLSAVIAESARVVRRTGYFMVPVARSGRDEGWMTTQQSFFNNSVAWWIARYRASYPCVEVFDSAWNDTISVGKWFACHKDTQK